MKDLQSIILNDWWINNIINKTIYSLVTKSSVVIKFNLELEADYNSFDGRTPEEFADLLEEDLHVCLSDFRENDVQGIFSQVESVSLIEQN